MRSSIKHLLVGALAIAACTVTAQAATKITYDEIPTHIAPFGAVLAYRGFTVTTADGKTHSGRRLLLQADSLRIFHKDDSFEDLPNFDVTRIEIRQFGRFFHHIPENACNAMILPFAIASGAWDYVPVAAAVTPPIVAFAAVSTPVLLAADAVTFFIPPKVYEIIQ